MSGMNIQGLTIIIVSLIGRTVQGSTIWFFLDWNPPHITLLLFKRERVYGPATCSLTLGRFQPPCRFHWAIRACASCVSSGWSCFRFVFSKRLASLPVQVTGETFAPDSCMFDTKFIWLDYDSCLSGMTMMTVLWFTWLYMDIPPYHDSCILDIIWPH